MLALTKFKSSCKNIYLANWVILIFDKYLNSKISSILNHWLKDFWQGSPSSLFKIAYLLVVLELLKKKCHCCDLRLGNFRLHKLVLFDLDEAVGNVTGHSWQGIIFYVKNYLKKIKLVKENFVWGE